VSRRGWLLFVAMSILWGTPYFLIKVAVDEVSPWVLVFVRTALGAAVLVPLVARGSQWRALRGLKWPVLGYAVAEVVGPWLLLSYAEQSLSSGTTGLLIATVPIMGVALARSTGDRRRVAGIRWVGLVIGFAGVALLAAPTIGEGGTVWAVVLVLLSAFGFAVAPLIADRALREAPGLVVTVACLVFAAVVYAPAAALTLPATMPSMSVLVALAALAIVGTALAFLLFFELIREVGAARATVVTYINPAVAVALGAAVLGEPLTFAVLGSFVLILIGSVLATRRPRQEAPLADLSPAAGQARAQVREDRPQ
jgi:drug/metabolite transporter (DMT)-like permease